MVTRVVFEAFGAVATSEGNGLEKIYFRPPGFDGGIQFQWVVGLRCQFSTGKQPEATSGSLASVLSTTRLLESSGQQEGASVLKPMFHAYVTWLHICGHNSCPLCLILHLVRGSSQLLLIPERLSKKEGLSRRLGSQEAVLSFMPT